MEATDLKRLKALESENQKLKRMYAELALDHQMAKEIIEKSFKALRETSHCKGLIRVRH